MGQATFAELYYEAKKRTTRRERFLERLDRLVPWRQLEQRIAPHYPMPGRGRQPYPLSLMLRVHIVQLVDNLSDPAMEGRALRESHRAALRGAEALGRDPR